jgi:hypothetical protein
VKAPTKFAPFLSKRTLSPIQIIGACGQSIRPLSLSLYQRLDPYQSTVKFNPSTPVYVIGR